jgi:hypothetical protein
MVVQRWLLLQVASCLQGLAVVHQDFEVVDLEVPYIPGFLGFREVPAYKKLLSRVSLIIPQILMVDGFGVLHERRCGSASQLGVETGYPTIGVGKHLLHVDGLEEWLVLRELRAALSQDKGVTMAQRSEPSGAALSVQAPTATSSPIQDHSINPGGNMGMMMLSRGSSASLPPTADPGKRFPWQAVAEGLSMSSSLKPGLAGSFEDLIPGMSPSGAIGESGPVFEPSQSGVGPMGGMGSSFLEGSRSANLGSAEALDSLLPSGEETDTEDTGAIGSRTGASRNLPSISHLPGRDASPVACMDLLSSRGAHLGMALAGVAGTQRPIYVSVGELSS